MAAGCPQHRHQQVALLSTYLSLHHVPDVLIHGRPGTGKTLVVRHLATRPRCAYVSCAASSTLKSILAAAVAQFNGDNGKRKRAQGYALPPASEASLLWELQELCPQGAPSRVLVLDNITSLLPSPLTATPGDLSTVMSALGALRRGAGANLALWLVASGDPQCGLLPHLPPVLPVRFPAYSEEQVVDLLAEAAPPGSDAPLYRHFLDLAVPPAAAITRALPDLAALMQQLWGAAGLARPADRVGSPLSELEQSRARHQLQDHLARALGRLEPATASTAAAAAGGGGGGAAQACVRPGGLLHQGLELPTLGKLLLLAAYLASRNAPSVDKQLWDNAISGGKGRRRGGRRSQASDRQAEAAREQLLKGPHSFPLNRLLHIFQQLARSEAPSLAAAAPRGSAAAAAGSSSGSWPDQQQLQWPGQALRQAVAGGAGLGCDAGVSGSSGGLLLQSLGQSAMFGGGLLGADVASAGQGGSSSSAQAAGSGGGAGGGMEVLQQVQALVNQRLLSQTRSTDALEQPRYSCEAPAELVEHLAAELGVSLAQYLRYVV